MAPADKTLACRDCGQEFTFTVGEQEFFAAHGLQNEPSRCPECRAARRRERQGGTGSEGLQSPRQTFTAVCADCGVETTVPFKPRQGRPVYCRECYAKHTPTKI